ncbi:hypothetical protein TWF730_009738 [Orbilia blumenaviensis]|uniref:F-box domain-containing protein n=1 Tax=Orbilia blumenaviensis TaxID=1796055 RepID=A0AAV9UW45_9PEZI
MEPDATSQVLNTNELLEEILKHIPAGELLKYTRFVSKSWKELVEGSPKLQWKTWKWKETYIPPSVLEDPSIELFSANGRKYGFEFAADAVYWLHRFWRMMLTYPTNKEGGKAEHGLSQNLCEWMVEQIPDVELFRPRLEGISAMLQFSPDSAAEEIVGGAYDMEITDDKFTLRNFARLIFKHALSSRGLEMLRHLRHAKAQARRRMWDYSDDYTLIIVVSSALGKVDANQADSKDLDHPVKYSMNSTFVFELDKACVSSSSGLDVRIEYLRPGTLYPEAREEPPILLQRDYYFPYLSITT